MKMLTEKNDLVVARPGYLKMRFFLGMSPRCILKPLWALAGTLVFSMASIHAAEKGRWIETWAASPQPVWNADFLAPINFPRNLWNQTIRQIARVSIGGRQVRVALSNEYGSQPLLIEAAHIGLSEGGAATKEGSDRVLTLAEMNRSRYRQARWRSAIPSSFPFHRSAALRLVSFCQT
jgi:hypothetical protein